MLTVSGCPACGGQCDRPAGCLRVILQSRCSVGLSVRTKQDIRRWKCGHHRLCTQAMAGRGRSFSALVRHLDLDTVTRHQCGRVLGAPAKAALTLCLTAMACHALSWKRTCLVLHARKRPITALTQRKQQVINVNWMQFHQI